MAYLDLNGARLHYTDTEAGDVAVMFSHGLLVSTEMFADQIAHLKGKYRCIAYDHRGQGQSGAPEGEYDMDTLAGDAAALINAALSGFFDKVDGPQIKESTPVG